MIPTQIVYLRLSRSVFQILNESRFSRLVKETLPNVKEISVSELNHLITPSSSSSNFKNPNQESKPIVIDIRETSEHESGIIPGSIRIPRGILERDFEKTVTFNEHKSFVIVCAGGMRSVLSTDSLVKMGINNVRSLKGGIDAWKAEGLPLVKQ